MTPDPDPDPDPPTPSVVTVNVSDGGSTANYTVALKSENTLVATPIRSSASSSLPVTWGIDYVSTLYLMVSFSNSLRLPECRVNDQLIATQDNGSIKYGFVSINPDASPISAVVKLTYDN